MNEKINIKNPNSYEGEDIIPVPPAVFSADPKEEAERTALAEAQRTGRSLEAKESTPQHPNSHSTAEDVVDGEDIIPIPPAVFSADPKEEAERTALAEAQRIGRMPLPRR
jgi:hypothetical protein